MMHDLQRCDPKGPHTPCRFGKWTLVHNAGMRILVHVVQSSGSVIVLYKTACKAVDDMHIWNAQIKGSGSLIKHSYVYVKSNMCPKGGRTGKFESWY